MKTFLFTILAVLLCNQAFAATGYLTGERQSGLNNICYYESINGTFTKTIGGTSICPLNADDGQSYSVGADSYGSQDNSGGYTSGYLTGESTSGSLKTCYYDSVSGTFTKTISAIAICPLTERQ